MATKRIQPDRLLGCPGLVGYRGLELVPDKMSHLAVAADFLNDLADCLCYSLRCLKLHLGAKKS